MADQTEPKLLESLEAIRAALAAGPTLGRWKAGGHLKCTIYDRFGQRIANSFEGVMTTQRSDTECQANGRLIAACNPEAITAILDALKARDAEIERLRGALNLAVDHIDMSALRISHCKDAAAIDQARAEGGEKTK